MSEQKRSGWQQPAIPSKLTCSHIGVFFARLAVSHHAEGHEWICSCGKKFVVVSNGGENKRLVPKESDG